MGLGYHVLHFLVNKLEEEEEEEEIEEELAVLCFSRAWNFGKCPPEQGQRPASPNSSTLDTFFTLICYRHCAPMHAVLMMPLLEQKRTWNPDKVSRE